MKQLLHASTWIRVAAMSFLALTGVQFATAQSFTVTPAHTVTGTVSQYGYLALEIDFNNTSAASMRFEYELVSNSLPASWSAVMCDYTSCFPYVNNSRVMEPVASGDYAFIKLTVNPDSVIGSGTVVYKVWEYGAPSTEQTISFEVNTVVGVDDQNLGANLQISPNPTSGIVTLDMKTGSLAGGKLSVLSVSGQLLEERVLSETVRAEVNLGTYGTGLYLISFEDAQGGRLRKLVQVL